MILFESRYTTFDNLFIKDIFFANWEIPLRYVDP